MCFCDISAQLGRCMNKLVREQDKRRHVVCTMALMLYFYLTFGNLPVALGATLLTGWIKELFDERFGSGFCWYDIAANTVGATIACLMLASLGALAPQGP
jgi:hypothetical protein